MKYLTRKGRLEAGVTAAILLAVSTAPVSAVDIKVTGNIVAAPCDVDPSTPTNVDLSLGSALSADLKKAGTLSQPRQVTIRFINCPRFTTAIKATYSGTADTGAGSRFKNTGTAKNIAIELRDVATDTLIINGRSVSTPISEQQASVVLKAAMYSKGNVAAGTVIAAVTMTFEYQ